MTDFQITEDFSTTKKRGADVGVIYYRDLAGKKRRAFTKPCPQAWAKRRQEIRDMLVSGKQTVTRISLAAVAHEALDYRARLVGKKLGIREQSHKNDERHLRLHVLPTLGEKAMSRLTVGDINMFIDDMRIAGKAPKTQRSIINSLNMVCKYAIDKGYIASNPCARDSRREIVGSAGERQGYSADEVGQILAQPMADNVRVLITTAALTGLAANELQGLYWSDLNLQKGTLTVARTGYRGAIQNETKTEFRKRTIPLPALLIRVLREWKLQCGSGLYVLPSATGKMGDQKAWFDLVRTACKHAGVDNKGVGGFRKFYHTQMELDGVPDSIRKYRMGHSKKSNTAAIHYTVTDLKTAQSPADIEQIASRLFP